VKLKRLRLIGFKTFADKTEIELDEGITAVVGPNGCGKSNIADAILWVLGEQNPRLLRGTETKDFIFAGSERRKPVGMAEVQLIVDNSDGSLPLDFAEVAVGRRIYRSGESRYTINGAACRLKDIVDLFLDTGMGRGAYSFVGQTEVDAVLSARPEDRRELFDEAAGVQKYRTRKREALKKLETSEQNLTRIRDIVGELERQRAPLRDQAEVARRYLQMAERLRSVEVDLLIAETHRCDYELYAARADREEAIATVARLDEELKRLEAEAANVRESLSRADQEQETALQRRQAAAAEVADLEHRLQITLERLKHTEETARGLDAEMQQLAEREQELYGVLQRGRKALAKAAEERSRLEEALAGARQRYEELRQAAEQAQELGRDHAEAQRRRLAERTARETALTACRTRLEEARARLQEAEAELIREEKARGECAARLREARRMLETRIREAEEASQEQETALATRRSAEDARERAEEDLSAARRRYTERLTRLETLREMQAAGEGLFHGVRAVLQAAREGTLEGEYATVAEILRVPDRLRTALDVALGSGAQDIVCQRAEDARTAIAWLKTHRKGRATFLPLDSLDPPRRLSAADLDGSHGAVGVAADLVEYESRYRPAVELLLNRVVLFRDLDSAMHAARRLRGWSRLVTLDGELLTPGGAVTGGEGPGSGPRLVRRKGEIDDLLAETAALREHAAVLEQRLREAQEALNEAAAAVARCSEKVASAASARAVAERDLQNLQREHDAAARRCDELSAQAERLKETVAALVQEASQWEAALKADSAEDTSLDEAAEAARAEAQRYEAEASAARDELTRLPVELGRVGEQVRSLERSLQADEAAIRELQAARRSRQERRESFGARLREMEQDRAALTEALEGSRQKLTECVAEHERRVALRTECLNKTFALSGAIQKATTERARMMEQLHEADLKIARLEVRLNQCSERLSEEYGMNLEEALAAPEPPPMDRDTVQEIGRIRRELRAMGNVNTGAVEEYERLTERYEFLAAQQADLEKACASLRETIAEIDRSTRSVFMETFRAVEAEFQRLFVTLFDGGETQLVLTKPDNLLETGVEVVVRPPGKRAQNLSLLSGGERALTAVALLFSFLKVRPSPFVVLDEVDAALDGANVERFVELLRDFAQQTQFLIITHNPVTIEAASRWYGVTMQEPGVSRVISYRPDWPTREETRAAAAAT